MSRARHSIGRWRQRSVRLRRIEFENGHTALCSATFILFLYDKIILLITGIGVVRSLREIYTSSNSFTDRCNHAAWNDTFDERFFKRIKKKSTLNCMSWRHGCAFRKTNNNGVRKIIEFGWFPLSNIAVNIFDCCLRTRIV